MNSSSSHPLNDGPTPKRLPSMETGEPKRKRRLHRDPAARSQNQKPLPQRPTSFRVHLHGETERCNVPALQRDKHRPRAHVPTGHSSLHKPTRKTANTITWQARPGTKDRPLQTSQPVHPAWTLELHLHAIDTRIGLNSRERNRHATRGKTVRMKKRW